MRQGNMSLDFRQKSIFKTTNQVLRKLHVQFPSTSIISALNIYNKGNT